MSDCKHNWRKKSKDAGLLILRVLMGVALATHGYQKVFGGVHAQLAEGLVKMGFPMPTVFAWLASLSEFAGGLCIALGLGTRVAGLFVLITMGVAFFMAHGGSFAKGGELAYMFGIIALSLIFTGGGRLSLDSLICHRCCKNSECCKDKGTEAK